MWRRGVFSAFTGLAVAAVLAGLPAVASAGGGQAKSMQIYLHYQMPAPDLVPGDEARLARYDMFSFNRHRFYDLSPDTYSLVRAINPEVTILNYQQASDTWLDQDGDAVVGINNIARYNTSMGHSMGNLNTDNPGLFLLNSSGQRIFHYNSPNRYLLDFGHPSFQAYWLEATEHDVVDQPWRPDGVYIDNTSVTWGSHLGDLPAKYPTDAEWTAAMHSYQVAVATRMHQRGIKICTNTGESAHQQGYDEWLALDAEPNHPDFLGDEGAFCNAWGGDGRFYSETRWKRQIDLMTLLQNCGLVMRSQIAIPEGGSGTDQWGKPFTYWDVLWFAVGSYLLGNNDVLDNAYFTFSNTTDKYFRIYWYDEYDRIDLGAALGPYQVANYSGRNIYWREFAKGYVYVNPTTGDVGSIPLPEPCKQLSHDTINLSPGGFADVTTISLVAHRAAVLLKSSMVLPTGVVGRYVFYNNSAFDGNDPAASAADDAAIATDKSALLPGGVASFANYTSYSRGINGVMVDISGGSGVATASDFIFFVGNSSDSGTWTFGPAPTSVTVRTGAGAGGSDRITIIWPDNAIQGQWLRVITLATANTGLSEYDEFYFGNAIGETGDSPSDAEVTPTDAVAVRNNPATLGVNPAGITDVCDFNRDKKVGPTDQIICRNNGTSGPTALQLITVP